MTDADTRDAGEADEYDREYLRWLSTIRANSGHPQHPLCDIRGLTTSYVRHASHDKETADNNLSNARERGHIVEWTDDDGRGRVGLTPEGFAVVRGETLYSEADIEPLREIAETESNRDEPDVSVIQWATEWRDRIQNELERDRDDEATDQEAATHDR